MDSTINLKPNRIAIVADWLIDFGWAELVISHLLEMFPEADIYTSVCYMKHPMLVGRRVYTSWIQRIPFLNRRHKLAGLLRPWAFRSFDLSRYDIVICSSSAESKQVAMGKWRKKLSEWLTYTIPAWDLSTLLWEESTINSLWKYRANWPLIIVYCHTPTRYYWSHAKEYEDMMEFGILNPFVKWIFRLVKSWMQRVDYAAAQKVDYFIANSENTKERIMKYYGRESEVIYPGVALPLLSSWGTKDLLEKSEQIPPIVGMTKTEEYYLWLGRCIPYKRFDLLVDTFNANGKKLILATATDTPLFRELKARSKPNIEWKYRPNDTEKYELMRWAKAFLFPPEEDFGLVSIEAMAMGTPVIAYGKWGALETVVEWETGVFFTPQTPEVLSDAIERFEKMDFDPMKIQEHAEKFSKERFNKNLLSYINSVL